jgi:glyoxylase-like metal-dependent hydrolase (beta-lactamase superfamily II)
MGVAIMSEYFKLEPLADGVYAALAVPGVGAWANAGFVDLGEEVLVFDTFMTPKAGAALRQAAEETTGKPVRYVVNSHQHLDHAGGNQAFDGCTLIATAKTRQMIGERIPVIQKSVREHPEFLDSLLKQAEEATDPLVSRSLREQHGNYSALGEQVEELVPTLPTVTFADRLHIHGSWRSVELIHMGAGHSVSDTILVVEDAPVAFMGDLLFVKNHASFPGGDIHEFVRILDRIAGEYKFEKMLPGHGGIGTMEDLQFLKVYLSDLITRAEEIKTCGQPLDEIEIPAKYAHLEAPGVYMDHLKGLVKG